MLAGSADRWQERRNEGLSPRHQVQFQSSIDLLHGVSLDAFARYISELPAGPVPAYATADLRLVLIPLRLVVDRGDSRGRGSAVRQSA
jgi:hypothetical protein